MTRASQRKANVERILVRASIMVMMIKTISNSAQLELFLAPVILNLSSLPKVNETIHKELADEKQKLIDIGGIRTHALKE